VAEEIISEFGEAVDTITLVKGSSGRFEVTVNGEPVFSKAELHRHAQPGEIPGLIRDRLAASGRNPARSLS
jgi:selT/selW/selH-like putative selenoprotein